MKLKICEFDAHALSCIPVNNGAESRLQLTKVQEVYQNVHPNLVLVPLFTHTEVECGKGLSCYRSESIPLSSIFSNSHQLSA